MSGGATTSAVEGTLQKGQVTPTARTIKGAAELERALPEGITTITALPEAGTACTPKSARKLVGVINADTAMMTGSCISIEHVLNVDADLHILPGSTLFFGSQAAIYVGDGALRVDGVEDHPVVFQGSVATPGYWRGVIVRSKNPMNAIRHARVLHAGSSPHYTPFAAGIFVSDEGMLALADVAVHDSGGFGLGAAGSAELTKLAKLDLTGNEAGPAAVGVAQVASLDPASRYAGENESRSMVHVKAADVTADATWPALGVPYRIERVVDVRAALTIEAGARFAMGPESGFYVGSGALSARGTSDRPIEFFGETRVSGFWRGLVFGSNNPKNALEHVRISDTGSSTYHSAWPAAVFVRAKAYLSVEHTKFLGGDGHGFAARKSPRLASFARNHFERYLEAPIRVSANRVGILDAATTIATEGDAAGPRPWIQVDRLPITDDAMWSATDAPLRFEQVAPIKAEITVQPGATLEFETEGGLYVQSGALIARGTVEKQIRFVPATAGANWKGLIFKSKNPMNALVHATVMNAGSGKHASARAANVYVANKARLTLRDSRIEGSSAWGLYAQKKARLDPANPLAEGDNTFANNARGDFNLAPKKPAL